MSLFSSLAPPDSRRQRDAFHGLSYIQTLHKAHAPPVSNALHEEKERSTLINKALASSGAAANLSIRVKDEVRRLKKEIGNLKERHQQYNNSTTEPSQPSNLAGSSASPAPSIDSTSSSQSMPTSKRGSWNRMFNLNGSNNATSHTITVSSIPAAVPPSSKPTTTHVLSGWTQSDIHDGDDGDNTLASLLRHKNPLGDADSVIGSSSLRSRPFGRSSRASRLASGSPSSMHDGASSGSQTSRSTKPSSRESMRERERERERDGSQTERTVHHHGSTSSRNEEEKRTNDSNNRTRFPRIDARQIAFAASSSTPSPSSSTFTTTIGSSGAVPISSSARTLEDELLELEREKRLKLKESKSADLSAKSDPSPSTSAVRPLLSAFHPNHPFLPNLNSTASSLLDSASTTPKSWETSQVQIDLTSHYTMFADKVAEYTHRLTQKLQSNLDLIRKKIHSNEQSQLSATRHQMREFLRFYHSHEGAIYDATRGIRDEERQLKLAELEESDLKKQQMLIHEDYQTQHASMMEQLYQLHANQGRNRETHQYLQAHSKHSDAQVSRLQLQSRRGSKVGAANNTNPNALSTSPHPQPQSQSQLQPSIVIPTSIVPSHYGGTNDEPSPSHSHTHSRRPSWQASTHRSKLNGATDKTTPVESSSVMSPKHQRTVSLPTASTKSVTPIRDGAQTTHDDDANTATASASNSRRLRRYSGDRDHDPTSSTPSRRSSRDGPLNISSTRSSRRSSRDLPLGGDILTAESSPADIQAKVDLLRSFWQQQFSSTRREREKLKELKSELLELEKSSGLRLEMEKLKIEGLEHQLAQVRTNHSEVLSTRLQELQTLRDEHKRIDGIHEALQKERGSLQEEMTRVMREEEEMYSKIDVYVRDRIDVTRANENIVKELERQYFDQIARQASSCTLVSEVFHSIRADFDELVRCPSCGYVIHSASITWDTGDTSCEKCAFQQLFPSNFQAVVKAMHKQFAASTKTLTKKEKGSNSANSGTPANNPTSSSSLGRSASMIIPKDTNRSIEKSRSTSLIQRASSFIQASIQSPASQTDGDETSSFTITLPNGSRNSLTLPASSSSSVGSHSPLRSHRSTPRHSDSGDMSSGPSMMDDLGARLMSQMVGESGEAATSPAGLDAHGLTHAQVQQRLKRGSLGGFVDALTAYNDANKAQLTPAESSTHSRSPSTGGNGTLLTGSLGDKVRQLNSAASSASSASGSSSLEVFSPDSLTPAPRYPVSPSLLPPRHLQELSEVNTTRIDKTSGIPFTLLWMKNRVVDFWLSRYGAYKLQLEDVLTRTLSMPTLLQHFEQQLSEHHQKRMAAIRKEEIQTTKNATKQQPTALSSSTTIASTSVTS